MPRTPGGYRPHDELIEEIVWGLVMGMTRKEIGVRLGYPGGRKAIDAAISRERKYAERDGRRSRI